MSTLLTETEIDNLKVVLKGTGYDPDKMLGNLLKSLGCTPEKVSSTTMPKRVADVLIQYCTQARWLKTNWNAIKAGEKTLKWVSVPVEKTKLNWQGKEVHISLEDAKEQLKVAYRRILRDSGY